MGIFSRRTSSWYQGFRGKTSVLKVVAVDAVVIAVKRRHLHLLQKLKAGKILTTAETKELAEHEKDNRNVVKSKGDLKRDTEKDLVIRTQKGAAAYVGRNERTIRRWVQAGMPRTQEGYYLRHSLDYFSANEGKLLNVNVDRKQRSDADYKELRAQKLKMEIEQLKGEYCLVADIERERIERIMVIKNVLLGLPRKLSATLVGKGQKEIQRVITKEIHYAIDVFAGIKTKDRDQKSEDRIQNKDD